MSHELYRMEAYDDGVEDDGVDSINCPWCGEVMESELSSLDTANGDEEWECHSCKKPVILRTDTNIDYTAFKAHQVRATGAETTRNILVFEALRKFFEKPTEDEKDEWAWKKIMEDIRYEDYDGAKSVFLTRCAESAQHARAQDAERRKMLERVAYAGAMLKTHGKGCDQVYLDILLGYIENLDDRYPILGKPLEKSE